MKKKRVLVYPCGTEIGLEIYKALCNSMYYELWGGGSTKDHGSFVYKNYIEDLPFITDFSSENEIRQFNSQISKYGFDFIYPAMDGVITVMSKYRDVLSPTLIAPDFTTNEITRSKKKTYQLLENVIPVPHVYNDGEIVERYPVFMKPDKGQGSQGTVLITDEQMLINERKKGNDKLVLEYLPGEEYTVDCFTNLDKKLIFAKGRLRGRVKSGISMNTIYIDNPIFEKYALLINNKLGFNGAWFFQLKRDVTGELKLLEVASRLAGTSAIARNIGVNLPLLTLEIFNGQRIDTVIPNSYYIELDRALENNYHTDLTYSNVYIDFDDTVIIDGKINVALIQYLYQCVNNKIKIILLTKHEGNIVEELKKYKLYQIFDDIINIKRNENKKDFITSKDSIFIDDSFNERRIVKEFCNIPVFDTHMIECLMK